jgi:hypothetical protein
MNLLVQIYSNTEAAQLARANANPTEVTFASWE